MRPQFTVKNNHVFPTIYNKSANGVAMPWFEIKGTQVYKTDFHPEGKSIHPIYEVRGSELHNTVHHPEGIKNIASFHMRTKPL